MKNMFIAMIALLSVVSLTACSQTAREYPGQKPTAVFAGKTQSAAHAGQGGDGVCIGEECSCHSMNMD